MKLRSNSGVPRMTIWMIAQRTARPFIMGHGRLLTFLMEQPGIGYGHQKIDLRIDSE